MTDVKVCPCGDRILIQFDPKEDTEMQFVGGIFRPEGSVDDVHQWGTVLRVGPGKMNKNGGRVPVNVSPGDRVLYIRFLKNTHSGEAMRSSGALEGDQFLIRASDVIAVEEKEGDVKVRPLNDRILVKRAKAESVSSGGIILPEDARESPLEAEVLAVGSGAVLESGVVRPLEVKKGDEIIFGKYAGTDLVVDGEDYLLLRESDVLGIVVL